MYINHSELLYDTTLNRGIYSLKIIRQNVMMNDIAFWQNEL